MRFRQIAMLLIMVGLLFGSGWQYPAETVSAAPPAQGEALDNMAYLPMINSPPIPEFGRSTINAPYFDVADVMASKFSEMAVAWFGEVTPSANYADIRVAYNNTDLTVYVQVIDRRLWTQVVNPASSTPTGDALTLYLDTQGASKGAPAASSYKLLAQFYKDGLLSAKTADDSRFELSYKGNGSQWVQTSAPFYTLPGWDGNYPNDNTDDNGWAMTFRIPYTSLGLSGRPPDGSEWSFGVQMTDRDESSAVYNPDQTYPQGLNGISLASWGRLRFGMPGYSSGSTAAGTVTIRHRLNGATVPDAGVGGQIGALCYPGDSSKWTNWGTRNFAAINGLNVQNQSKIGDWPCFARYYVSFPLGSVPAGKVITSATVTLHQWGGSWDSTEVAENPGPSLVQAFVVKQDWQESSINWNNAPLPLENVAQTWAPIFFIQNNAWPGQAVSWDISRAAADAYRTGQPLRLAFYEADNQYHSGKYFTTSDTDDWNAAGRPTLVIQWGNPR